jgi:hypothetical protein
MKSQKSKRTLNRMAEIKACIHSYQESIILLHKVIQGQIAPEIRPHPYTPQDELRRQWTLKNITLEMTLLQRELTVLQEYGA